MTVYGRFFKLYMYTALAPIPLSTFAGEPSQNVGKSFIKSYCAVLLEGAVIVLACIIFSVFASSPPVVDTSAAAVTQVWAYIGELVFNMLVLVGSVMKNGTMFSDLEKFKSKDFWEEHKTFRFDTLYVKQTYEIIAVFKTAVYTGSEIDSKS